MTRSGGPRLRGLAHTLLQRLAVIAMMAAAMAFTLQGTFIAAAQNASGENSHFHHGYADSHGLLDGHDKSDHAESHVVAHAHTDGTIHQHVVDDDDDALNDHIQEPGCPCCWNAAIVIGVLPNLMIWTVAATLSGKLAIEMSATYRGTEPIGLRRPPRPPSIA
jgi:hypothetical protein